MVSENLKETASQLSIHYKTLMFRKKKLEEILGVSFDNLASRMAVLGAVQLLKVLEEKNE
ncbi:MAG: helix-turn-helix domain-containing protein [Deltaproteobacteria bacterium]|nr:helix-turn-helix domain-containing protein [Deltaproteobacteria bacterium]